MTLKIAGFALFAVLLRLVCLVTALTLAAKNWGWEAAVVVGGIMGACAPQTPAERDFDELKKRELP